MVVNVIPCPHKKGFITRGRFNENKNTSFVYRLRQLLTSSSYDEITFTYCPVCMESFFQRIKELNNRGLLTCFNLNRAGHHFHVGDSRGRSEYLP